MKNFIAGNFVNQGHYQAFIPKEINRLFEIDNMEVVKLLSLADRQLGRLDMYSNYVNIDLYISMHIAKEATQSSRIEGTQTNVEDAFMSRDEIAVEKRDDWEEVQNYIKALNESASMLSKLPFSSRLIRKAHEILMNGVRGQHKQPGEFRKSQNWIGGATLSDAVFIPPPHSEIPNLMSDLEKFANAFDNPLPDLIKIAIIHYQFETIHPFLDGNGRIGRLLIPIYLVGNNILKRPILYLSDFFERNRQLYYDNLMRVRSHNNLTQWLKFFLTGVIETAKSGISTFDSIMQLQSGMEDRLKPLKGRTSDALKVINYMYERPIIDAPIVSNIIGKSKVSAYKLIHDLEELKIIRELTGAKKGRVYLLHEYMALFKG